VPRKRGPGRPKLGGEAMAPSKKVAGVYLIRRAGGPVKIGHAGDVYGRLDDMQVATAEKLTLLAVLACDDPKSEERRLHAQLAAHRIRGEWFRWHADIEAVANRIGVPEVRVRRPVGRPKLGASARSVIVPVRITKAQYKAIAGYVRKENAEVKAAGGDGATATVSSWVRDVIEESIPARRELIRGDARYSR
jgi:Meiotically Up-regulated Gene 113 (MUG113) protein